MTLWFCHHNPSGFRDQVRRLDLAANPSPAILAGGIDGDHPRTTGWKTMAGIRRTP